MQRIRVVGLAMVVVSAVCAIGAAGASAAKPIWFSCAKAPKNEAKQYIGHYAGKECKKAEYVATGGKYELVPRRRKGQEVQDQRQRRSSCTRSSRRRKPTSSSNCKSFKGEGTPTASGGIRKVNVDALEVQPARSSLPEREQEGND